MAKMGRFSDEGFKKLQKQLNRMRQEQVEAFLQACARELAARLLAKVIRRTPVGDYSREVKVVAKRDSKRHKKGDVYMKRVNPSGKQGGTLRRGWTSKTHEEAAAGTGMGMRAREYAESMPIQHQGDMISVEIINPVEYASYVEFGHRTRNHSGWVPGSFMLTMSEQEIRRIAPQLLEKRIRGFLEGCMR